MKPTGWVLGILGVIGVGCAGGSGEPTGTGEEGVRKCVENVLCAKGEVFSQKACTCVPEKGQKCGTKTCGQGDYCCNASCGMCAPIGAMCIQIACQ